MTQSTTPKDFDGAMAYLASFTDYEQKAAHELSRRSMDLGRMQRNAVSQGLLPHAFPVVHIAGSKSKGSTALFVDSILQTHGRRTGRFLSPHLTHITERISLDGVDVSIDAFVQLVQRLSIRVQPLIEATSSDIPTFFEAIALMAMDAFTEARVDAAIFEVGLGGRLDATNIITPSVSLITSIDLEHTRVLGDDLGSIAREKAGIIKAGIPVISGVPPDCPAGRAIAEVAASHEAPLTWLDEILSVSSDGKSLSVEMEHLHVANLCPSTRGIHQLRNAALAIAACEIMLPPTDPPLTQLTLQSALDATELPGRLQWIPASGNPLQRDILLDSAHTKDSMRALAVEISRRFKGRPVALLTALLNDKTPDRCLEPIQGLVSPVFATAVASPRSTAPDDLAAAIRQSWPTTPVHTSEHTLTDLQQLPIPPDLPLVIAGSTYLAGEILNELRSFPQRR